MPDTLERHEASGVAGQSGQVRQLRARRRHRLRYAAIGIAAIGAVAFGAREIYLRFTHVYEYDARITTDLVTVSSRTDGWLVERRVDEGDRVKAGDVLARIDDRVARLKVSETEAQIAALDAQRRQLQAQRELVDAQTQTRIASKISAVHVSEHASAALEADLALAHQELDRARTLVDKHAGTVQQLDAARAAVRRLENRKRQLQSEVAVATGAVDEARADRDQLAVIDSQLATLDHQRAALAVQLEQQKIDVSDRTIRAPIPGVVDRKFVEGGEYVTAGQRILLMHDPSDAWVEANIKETAVSRLKVGQPVAISVDAYPDRSFQGTVKQIGTSTTAKFALLPTPNPSGNFTKITQRVPVRISIEDPDQFLSPGMMVEVEIDVR